MFICCAIFNSRETFSRNSTITISIVLQHSFSQKISIYLFICSSIYLFTNFSFISHVMISLSSWFLFLCDCFVNDYFMFDIAIFKISQRIYQIHRDHFLCCKWYLQIERVRDIRTKQTQQQVRSTDWNQTIEQCI